MPGRLDQVSAQKLTYTMTDTSDMEFVHMPLPMWPSLLWHADVECSAAKHRLQSNKFRVKGSAVTLPWVPLAVTDEGPHGCLSTHMVTK